MIDNKRPTPYVNQSKPAGPLRKQAKIGGFLYFDKETIYFWFQIYGYLVKVMEKFKD